MACVSALFLPGARPRQLAGDRPEHQSLRDRDGNDLVPTAATGAQ